MARFKNKDLLLGTDEEVIFGDAQEAYVKYDGSDLVINKVPYHETKGYLATQDYVNYAIMGLEWQDSVLSMTTDVPAGVYGERYIVPSGASGAWSGLDDNVAEYTTTWVHTTPSAGFATWVEDEGAYFVYNGSNWIRFGSVIDHGLLDGLADDDHIQYLLADGTRELIGTLQSTTVSAGTFEGPGWDHSSMGGLADDDHTQYLLADGSRDLTGTLTVSTGSGLAMEIWQNNDTAATAGIKLIGNTIDNRYGYIYMSAGGYLILDTSIGNIEVHKFTRFTSGGTVHDDGIYASYGYNRDYAIVYSNAADALQIVDGFTVDTNVRLSLDSAGDFTFSGDISAASFFGDGTRLTGLLTDHSELTGLSDDDHPIYLPSDGSRAMTGTLTVNTTGGYMRFSGLTANIGLASDIDMINLSGVGVTVNTDLTVTGSLSADHSTLLGLTDDDHSIYLNTTRHDTTDRHGAASVDHGLIDGLGDDDHVQYFLTTGTRPVSGDILAATAGIDIGSVGTPFSDIYCDTLHTSAGSVIIGTATLTDVAGVLTSDVEIEAPTFVGDGTGLTGVAVAQAGWTYGSQVATNTGTTVVLTTAIPTSATEVQVILKSTGTNTSSQPPIIQLGDGEGYETSGYLTGVCHTGANEIDTDGFYSHTTANYANVDHMTGVMCLERWDPSEHTWVGTGNFYDENQLTTRSVGQKTTSAVLTSIRLTTPGGSATFDNGEARVRWR